MRILRTGICFALLACAGGAWARTAAAPPATPDARAAAASAAPTLSSVAERIYSEARPRLLQIRTLLVSAGRQSSLGSGFVVSADGLVITNYHVVSQVALEPKTYRLEYAAPDGSSGALKLLAIDVANDLAVVKLDKAGLTYFGFDERALAGKLPKGEHLYSMGNPLDLGFTIVEGTYSGLVERSYNERIHFSGAINAGMSGGPTVTGDGRIVGINVSKLLSGELVSFLVPVRFAAALLARAQNSAPLSAADARAEIGRQLLAWQSGLYTAVHERGFRPLDFGPYSAPESAAAWFSCWARTNADNVPKPRAIVNTTNCRTDTQLFLADDLTTGPILISHSYVKSVDLNAFQFANILSSQYQPPWSAYWNRKHQTRQRCHEDNVVVAAPGERPMLHAVWCARAYREFDGLYDVFVLAVTQDHDNEALVSKLAMQAVSYDNATAIARQFIEAVRWTK
jgi:serine protease Do